MLRLFHEWEDALNAGDVDKLGQIVSEDVAIIGPRGRAVGREVLGEWVERARLRTRTSRAFIRGGTLVAAQEAIWQSQEREVLGEARIASRFKVSGNEITEYERYDDLTAALNASGLGQEDEVDLRNP